MNVNRLVPLLSCAVLLSACGDRNAPSTALFEKVIKADKSAIQPVCGRMHTGVESLPSQYLLEAESDAFFQRYRALEKLGYTTIKKVKAQTPLGIMEAWDVQLTPSWLKDFGELKSQECIGEWTAQSVKTFSQPADLDGIRISEVQVTGTQTFTGWAANPRLRKVMSLDDLPPTAERSFTLVLMNTGWQVQK